MGAHARGAKLSSGACTTQHMGRLRYAGTPNSGSPAPRSAGEAWAREPSAHHSMPSIPSIRDLLTLPWMDGQELHATFFPFPSLLTRQHTHHFMPPPLALWVNPSWVNKKRPAPSHYG